MYEKCFILLEQQRIFEIKKSELERILINNEIIEKEEIIFKNNLKVFNK
jgi:hypothetical protein